MNNLRVKNTEPREITHLSTEVYAFIAVAGIGALTTILAGVCHCYNTINSEETISLTHANFVY